MIIAVELIGVALTTLLGALFPILRDIVKQHLKKSKAKGKESSFDKFLTKVFRITLEEPTSYKQRLASTLEVLKNAFSEVDKATAEFTALMKEKEKSIDLLEARLSQLSNEETVLKSKVETLQKVPIEALTHFEEILSKGDKRSAYRDYILFVSGAVLSVIITLILKFYFNV